MYRQENSQDTEAREKAEEEDDKQGRDDGRARDVTCSVLEPGMFFLYNSTEYYLQTTLHMQIGSETTTPGDEEQQDSEFFSPCFKYTNDYSSFQCGVTPEKSCGRSRQR
jgi:hypothetical protein